MKAWAALGCVLLTVLPSCLLVQPLDDAKPADGSAGSGAAGSGNAGTGNAGSGNAAGSNNAGTGNVPNEVDFSLFTGTWIIKSGEITTTCGAQMTTDQATPGDTSELGLGTTSDLILDPGTLCPILLDVDDRTATSQDGQTCTLTQDGTTFDLSVDYIDFIITSADTSATSTFYASATTTTGVTCNFDQHLYYERF